MSLWLLGFGPILGIIWLIALVVAIVVPKTTRGKLLGVGLAVVVPYLLGMVIHWVADRENYLSWSEEVKLQDGTVLNIKRTVTLHGPGEPGHRRTPSKWTIEMRYPQGTEWVSDGGTQPWVFDVYRGTPYIAATIGAVGNCDRHGSPKNGALFYKFDRQQGWKKIQVDQFPRVLDTNLMLSVFATSFGGNKLDDASGFISLKTKEQRDRPRRPSLWTWMETNGTRACRP
jgi:hypothetical protein